MIKTRVEIDKTKLNLWMRKNYPGLSMTHLQKLCRIGEIRINGGRAKYNSALAAGDEVKLPPSITEYASRRAAPAYSDDQKEALSRAVIFESDEAIAIDKPAGLASQGGSKVRAAADSLLNAARPLLAGSARLVHRIDKETSGVLLFAKTLDAARRYADLFSKRKAKKTYIALVHGSIDPKAGTISKPVYDQAGEPKAAITEYKVLDEASGLLSLVELCPRTGRNHQLRLHMKSIGHPIIGDEKHARKGDFERLERALGLALPRNLYLHALKLAMPGEAAITAPIPDHFRGLLDFFNMDTPK
jgi:23S rRNA pseudouridine955/2504/2580 synthase